MPSISRLIARASFFQSLVQLVHPAVKESVKVGVERFAVIHVERVGQLVHYHEVAQVLR